MSNKELYKIKLKKELVRINKIKNLNTSYIQEIDFAGILIQTTSFDIADYEDCLNKLKNVSKSNS